MIPPWMLVVSCLGIGCLDDKGRTIMPDLGANNFATQAHCEHALIEIATRWHPPKDSRYTFNCRRWPW